MIAALRLFTLLIALALAACSRPMDRAELVVLNGAEPETLDPAATAKVHNTL